MRPTYKILNLDHLRDNLRTICQHAPRSQCVAVLKANAYGCGIEQIYPVLSDADLFATASIDEGLALRQVGADKPILLLEGVFEAAELAIAYREGFEPTIATPEQLAWLLDYPERFARVWFKLDTGMGRLGFFPEDGSAQDALEQLLEYYAPESIVLMTHFSASDESAGITQQQIAILDAFAKDYPQCKRSLCNSAGIFHYPKAHGDFVRPGLALYGISPFADCDGESLGLKPVVSLFAQVFSLKYFPAGSRVGYGQEGLLNQDAWVALCSVGYGDGYPRLARSGMPVAIKGRIYNTIGRVAMDMTAVLVDEQVQIGDPVELYGEQVSAEQLCQFAGIIGQTLLTQQTSRPRVQVIETMD